MLIRIQDWSLDMPNSNSCSTAQQMYGMCNEVREAFSLDWDNCVTHSSDNTNPMIGQLNSLFQNIQIAQGSQKIFDVGWPSHLTHVCAEKGAKELAVTVKDFVIEIYYHFRRSAKPKKQLWEFMNFNNTVMQLEK